MQVRVLPGLPRPATAPDSSIVRAAIPRSPGTLKLVRGLSGLAGSNPGRGAKIVNKTC
jgi:hypothetical protein